MSTVKLAVVQMSCSDVLEDNLDKAEAFVREAAGAGANIILLQELFENLYFPQLERDDLFALAHPSSAHPFLEHSLKNSASSCRCRFSSRRGRPTTTA